MYPELNHNGRIHFHGVIHIYDKVKWYKQCLPKLKFYGMVCIKPYPDFKWMEYIQKDVCSMQIILKTALPYTIFMSNPKKRQDEILNDIVKSLTEYKYIHPLDQGVDFTRSILNI